MSKLSPSNPPPPIAAFDFDGTLTYKDSFVSYLIWKCGLLGFLRHCVSMPHIWLDYLIHKDRGPLKLHLINAILGKISHEALMVSLSDFFAAYKDRLLRPDAFKVWQDHKALGHECVIVTASPDILVAYFGKYIGADRVIGTRFVYDAATSQLRLEGLNNRCAEKVRRLKEAYGQDLVILDAYGDTKGDLDMLKVAQNGHYKVFKEKPTYLG